MPFDTAAVTAHLPAGYCGDRERDPAQFIPYFDHVRPGVVQYRRAFGSRLMAMVKLDGANWFLGSDAQRTGSWRVHYGLLQLLADRHTEISEHLCVNVEPPDLPLGPHGTDYAKEFWRDYQDRCLSGAKSVEWYITVSVEPGIASRVDRGIFSRKMRAELPPNVDDRALRILEGKVQAVLSALRWHGARRLGIRRNARGKPCSEIGEALTYIRTLRRQDVPLAQPAGSFGPNCYTDRVATGPLGFLIYRDGGLTRATVGRMLLMQSYPAGNEVRHGMLDAILAPRAGTPLARARFVLTNHARPLERAAAKDALELIHDRLVSSGSRAGTDIADVLAALDQITSGRGVRARHAWSLAVHADTVPELDEVCTEVATALKAEGCHPVAAGSLAGEAAYWGQWPGNRGLSSRPARIPLDAMACLSSLDGYPDVEDGPPQWGHFLAYLLTPGRTIRRLDAHDERNPHCLFVAPIRAGKSVFAAAKATMASFLLGEDGRFVVLDKDRSQALMVKNNGGSYAVVRRGVESGCAPLMRLTDGAEDREMIEDLVHAMITAEDPTPLLPLERDLIAEGVGFVMSMPAHLRSIGAIHAYLPPGGAADRLKPWCRGERKGWAMDGEVDSIGMDRRYVGVDLSEILNDAAVLPVVSLYLTHLTRKLADGRRKVILLYEEARFLLQKPALAARIEDFVLTGGKWNIAVWLVCQDPGHLLSHPSGATMLPQFRRRFLFKNEMAAREAYCGHEDSQGNRVGGFGCTDAEFEEITVGLTSGERGVLLQCPGKSERLAFDLTALPRHVPILSSFPQNVDLWDAICAEMGTEDPDIVRPEFLRRLRQ